MNRLWNQSYFHTLLQCVLVVLLVSFSGSLAAHQVSRTPSQNADTKIEVLSNEILVIKAELAHLNNNLVDFKEYFSKIKPDNISSTELRNRYLNLRKVSKITSSSNYISKKSRIVLLVPLSGKYGEIGQSISEAFLSMNPNIPVIDSSRYTKAVDLLAAAKLYKPNIIIGPYNISKIRSFCRLKISMPVIVLNRTLKLSRNNSNCIQASFKTYWQLFPVTKKIKTANNKKKKRTKIAMIIDGYANLSINFRTAVNRQIHVNLRQNWRNTKASVYNLMFIKKNGKYRRIRKDITDLIFYGKYGQAQEITNQLKAFNNRKTTIHWIPSEMPLPTLIYSDKAVWSDTSAWLPYYYHDMDVNNVQHLWKKYSNTFRYNQSYQFGKDMYKILQKILKNGFYSSTKHYGMLGQYRYSPKQKVIDISPYKKVLSQDFQVWD